MFQPVGTTLSLKPSDLVATDPDANNSLTFETDYDWFSLSGNKIVVAHQFDRETENAKSSFSIFVRDQNGLQDSGTVTLTVYDINDNAPVFASKNYSTSVLGNFVVRFDSIEWFLSVLSISIYTLY